MSVNWTEEQKKVIESRNRNLLVSAAAGSGKTAVLVERIIHMITDKDNPVDVDKLLVVTFTKAAAAEMKERIRNAIEQKLSEEPWNRNLERQSALIHHAMITTIHSFCLSVVRDHFHAINIDPGFRTVEEGELKLLKKEAMDEIMEAAYQKNEETFLSFVEKYGTGRNDKKIEDLILQMYEYSRSYPQPERWLESCIDTYRIDASKVDSCSLTEQVLARAKQKAEDALILLQIASASCLKPDGPYMYESAIEADIEQVNLILTADSFSKFSAMLESLKWVRLPSKKDNTVSDFHKEEVKNIRTQVKKIFTDMKAKYFDVSPDVWAAEMNACVPDLLVLVNLVKAFSNSLEQKKRTRNLIDFTDMEQYALKILTEEINGELVPSKIAKEYQELFEEIMIDEYQDSNLVQETLLQAVSRCHSGNHNIFMVGDVKQSIYRFRMSRPELFIEKYDRYTEDESDCQKIDLHKNFRSRKEVLDGANFVFSRMMRKDFGGIAYDEAAALNAGASFMDLPDSCNDYSTKPELMLLDKTGLNGEDARIAEAEMISDKIRDLKQNGLILDKKTGKYRNITYRDIVILTRSTQGWADNIAATLNNNNIPSYAVSTSGYFETYEISVLIDYLKLLDNFKQDLPLAAVLSSPFACLDANDLAKIKAGSPDGHFYDAFYSYIESGDDKELRNKLVNFRKQLADYKKMLPYTEIHKLLYRIITETGYGLCMKAMPGGTQRYANIEMLLEKAAAYETTSYKGLFNFIRYMDQLKKYEVDYGEASVTDESDDTVKIMSIHKSKGLEFPIVIVAGLGKKFNTQDIRNALIMSPDGIGIDFVDLDTRIKKPTFLKNFIQEQTKMENLYEELRILYVALTRAKEKLILTGSIDGNLEDTYPSGDLSLHQLESAGSYLDWLIPAVCQKESPFEISEITVDKLVSTEKCSSRNMHDYIHSLLSSEISCPGSDKDRFDEQMNYLYPHEPATMMKLKYTVSELKKKESKDTATDRDKSKKLPELIPDFMKNESEKLKGASRGTAYHDLLKAFDFTKKYYHTKVKDEIQRMVQSGLLDQRSAISIRPADILSLLNSSSGQRIAEAQRKGRLHREQPFVISRSASQLFKENISEDLLVQGIVDVYFEEDDGIVLLDYKTDYVKSGEELIEKYRTQLDIYAEALEQLTGKRVKEKIIYSFKLKKEIKL